MYFIIPKRVKYIWLLIASYYFTCAGMLSMEEYVLDKNNCVYIDLYEKIEEIGLDGTTDFSDEGHLNTSGSNKVADYLGEYLIGHYELTDFRDYENNIWIESQK